MRSERCHSSAGFTLVEVLVALGVLAVALVAIGSLVATTVRGMHAIDNHFTLAETGRAIETAMPARDQLAIGNASGELDGHRWRIDVLPFVAANVDPRQPTLWVPQRIVTRVLSPAGAMMQIETVRLRRREAAK
jgi:general secretion pathway protein I